LVLSSTIFDVLDVLASEFPQLDCKLNKPSNKPYVAIRKLFSIVFINKKREQGIGNRE
jgi:hypothetical protein